MESKKKSIQSIADALSQLELSHQFDFQQIRSELTEVAISSYRNGFLKEREEVLRGLRWHSAWRPIDGSLHLESLAPIAVEVEKTSIPLFNAEGFTEDIYTKLMNRLQNQTVLRWKAFQLALNDAFQEANRAGKIDATKQVLSLLERQHSQGWAICKESEYAGTQHLIAVEVLLEKLRNRIAPRRVHRS